MTLKELNQYYYLKTEVIKTEQRIAELEELYDIQSLDYSGIIVQNSVNQSRVEKLASDIIDLKNILLSKKIAQIEELIRIEFYLNEIPDSLTRQIFYSRFINHFSWNRVAREIGGGITGDGCRKIVTRYISNK